MIFYAILANKTKKNAASNVPLYPHGFHGQCLGLIFSFKNFSGNLIRKKVKHIFGANVVSNFLEQSRKKAVPFYVPKKFSPLKNFTPYVTYWHNGVNGAICSKKSIWQKPAWTIFWESAKRWKRLLENSFCRYMELFFLISPFF